MLEEVVLLGLFDEEATAEEEVLGVVEELARAAELVWADDEPCAAPELIAVRPPQEPSVKSEAAAKMNKNLFFDIKESFFIIYL